MMNTKILKRRFLPFFLTGIMTVNLFSPAGQLIVKAESEDAKVSAVSADVVHSGKSNNVEWSIDSNGHLKLWGTGNYNFDNEEYRTAWGQYADEIKTAEVDIKGMTTLAYMFYHCENLTEVDLSKLDTANVDGMDNMFDGCSSLTTVDISHFDTSKVVWFDEMFYGCNSLTSVDVSGFDTSSAVGMRNMFNGCENLRVLDVSGFDTTTVMYMSHMFDGCRSLEVLDVSGFVTPNVESVDGMFQGCENVRALDVSGFDLTYADDLYAMFGGCRSLTSLDVSNFNTSNIKSMESMFDGCVNLQALDVSNFDTSKVWNMNYMFNECENLKTLNVSGFHTSKVECMERMFAGCRKLTTVDVSEFDTSNVNNMNGLFELCYELEEVDVSGFDTAKVENMTGMFYNCKSVKVLDLSGFVLDKIEENVEEEYAGTDWLLQGCDTLEKLYTPLKARYLIELPAESGDVWVDEEGNEYTHCPLNQNKTVLLTRKAGCGDNHTWEEAGRVEPTCTEQGKVTYKCSVCGQVKEDEINQTGHKYASWSKDETNHWQECLGCGNKVNIEKHDFSQDVEQCAICSYHKGHSLYMVEGIDATCEEDGTITYYACNTCEDYFMDKNASERIDDKNAIIVKAKGHAFTKYVSNNNATCTEDGTKTAKCDRCKAEDVKPDEGSAKGHDLSFVEAVKETCTENGSISYYKCVICKELFLDANASKLIEDQESIIIGATGHTFTNYISNNDATCTEDGTKTAKCDYCDEVDTLEDADSALGHTYGEDNKCIRCGLSNPDVIVKMDAEIVFVNAATTVDYTGDTIELTEDDVEVVKGTGEVSFRYYLDEECTTLLETPPSDVGIYYVKAVIAEDDDYNASITEGVHVLTIRPRTVASVSVSNMAKSIKISWKEREEADGYILYRRFKGTSEDAYREIKTIESSDILSYLDKNISQGKGYVYSIRSYADGADGTRIYGAMLTNEKKIVRTKITLITNQKGAVKVQWTKLSNVDGYRVYRKCAGDDEYTLVTNIRNGKKNYYVDKEKKVLRNGKTTYYYVKPYYDEDDGYVRTTNRRINYYVAPPVLSAASGNKKAFTIKWKKNTAANGYEIRYSTSKTFEKYTTVTVKNKNTLAKKVSGLPKNRKYYVKVRAYKNYNNEKYYSAWTGYRGVKTK